MIEAFQWDGKENWSEKSSWAMTKSIDVLVDCSLSIQTLEGVMFASIGDWIIRGIKGEIYPCKPDIFAATYEELEPCP